MIDRDALSIRLRRVAAAFLVASTKLDRYSEAEFEVLDRRARQLLAKVPASVEPLPIPTQGTRRGKEATCTS